MGKEIISDKKGMPNNQIKKKLQEAEKSGFTNLSKEQILAKLKSKSFFL